MKKLLCALLVFASACILMAQEGRNDSEFSTETRQINQRLSVVITGYNGTSKQIHIPDQIDGLPVAAIGDNAFRSRRIESVTFPATLVSIGNYAFYDNNLTVISIPPAVINIGIGAFDGNTLSENSSLNQKGTTYARSFTIEPAHSETVYQPKSNQPAPENVNIIVVPGYNPLQTSQARPNGNIVTIQQSSSPIQATPPFVSAAPAANRPVETAPTVAVNQTPPVPSNQTPQQPYAQPQQLYGYVQQTLPSSNNAGRRLNVIPENTIDLSTGESKVPVVTEESHNNTPPIKLYMSETYSVRRNPTPR
jgi:hypothetical protein